MARWRGARLRCPCKSKPIAKMDLCSCNNKPLAKRLVSPSFLQIRRLVHQRIECVGSHTTSASNRTMTPPLIFTHARVNTSQREHSEPPPAYAYLHDNPPLHFVDEIHSRFGASASFSMYHDPLLFSFPFLFPSAQAHVQASAQTVPMIDGVNESKSKRKSVGTWASSVFATAHRTSTCTALPGSQTRTSRSPICVVTNACY